MVALGTERIDRGLIEPIVFETLSSVAPERGHLLEMVCKAVLMMREGGPNYDPLLVERSAAELRVLIPPTVAEGGLVEEIFHRLGLGLIFMRRVRPGLSLASFRCEMRADLGRPRFGYLLINSSTHNLDLTPDCRILTYRSSILIHPADPLIPLLHERRLVTLRMDTETTLSPSRASRFKYRTFGEDKNWPSIHRLFICYPYFGLPQTEDLKRYVEYVRSETTDNKAMYLVTMEIPRRFQRQPWARELETKIQWGRGRGILPHNFDSDFAEHSRRFVQMMTTLTEKGRTELAQTGENFLYDGTLPGNIYGTAYMSIRDTL
jgi:hypothetical protein